MHKHIVSLTILLWWGIVVAKAQPVLPLENLDLTFSDLIPPLRPLPDSLYSYRIETKFNVAQSALQVTNANVPNYKVKQLERSTDAIVDLRIYVEIDDYAASDYIEQQRLDSVRSVYWYEEDIQPMIWVFAVNEHGDTILAERTQAYHTFKSSRFPTRTQAEAVKNIKPPQFKEAIREAHLKALKEVQQILTENFEYQSDKVSFYLPVLKKMDHFRAITAAEKVIQKLNVSINRDSALAILRPQIEFFKGEMTPEYFNSRKGEFAYLAAGLNLMHLYRCLDDYDNAFAVLRNLAEEDFSKCMPHAKQLVGCRKRYERHRHLIETGEYLAERKTEIAQDRLFDLAGRTNDRAEVLMADGQWIKGEILDLVANANQLKVKFRYEKTLMDPVQDVEFDLFDIREIRIPEWRLRVLEFDNTVFLTEVVYQTPIISVLRSFPKSKTYDWGNKRVENLDFLEIHDKNRVGSLELGSGVIVHCKKVERLWDYGYYASIIDLAKDYEVTCGTAPTVVAPTPATSTVDAASVKRVKKYNGPLISLEAVSGLNHLGQIALQTSIRLQPKMYLRASAGGGLWGLKYGVGLRFDQKVYKPYKDGWSASLIFAHTTGHNGVGNVGNGESGADSLSISFKPRAVNTLGSTVMYRRYFGSIFSANIELGYSFPLKRETWEIVSPETDPDDREVKKVMRFWQPGGIVFSIGAAIDLY
jgi:hypothetical protein